MKGVVGLVVSSGRVPRIIRESKLLTKMQLKRQAQTCSPSSAQCPITMASGWLPGSLGMVSLIQQSNRPNSDQTYLLNFFLPTGMPRILLSTANITASVLDSIGFGHSVPALAAPYPPLPKPFQVTKERVEKLQGTDIAKRARLTRERYGESSRKKFCRDQRWLPADAAVGV
jgi:hypothetical protein